MGLTSRFGPIDGMEAYLDNSVTTQMDDGVVMAMREWMEENYGSPRSVHHLGTTAREAIQVAKERVAALVDTDPDCLMFTSGGTEANNWVVRGVPKPKGRAASVIVSAVEHASVAEAARAMGDVSVVEAPVGGDGRLDLDALSRLIKEWKPYLVCVQHANGDVGTVQDIAAAAELCRKGDAAVLCDVCQSAGKIRFDLDDLGVEFASMSAHKMFGPMGVGALWRRPGSVGLSPLMYGEGDEAMCRPGATNVPAVVGFGEAARLACARLHGEPGRQRAAVEDMWLKLKEAVIGIRRNGHVEHRLPNVLSVTVPGMEASVVAAQLNKKYGVCVGTGVREVGGEILVSPALRACGLSATAVRSTLTLSISHRNNTSDSVLVADLVAYVHNALKRDIL